MPRISRAGARTVSVICLSRPAGAACSQRWLGPERSRADPACLSDPPVPNQPALRSTAEARRRTLARIDGAVGKSLEGLVDSILHRRIDLTLEVVERRKAHAGRIRRRVVEDVARLRRPVGHPLDRGLHRLPQLLLGAGDDALTKVGEAEVLVDVDADPEDTGVTRRLEHALAGEPRHLEED